VKTKPVHQALENTFSVFCRLNCSYILPEIVFNQETAGVL